MTQLDLNLNREVAAKEAGIARASRSRSEWLVIAKGIAVRLGIRGAIVTADLVQVELARQYLRYKPLMLGNAAGAIFRSKVWEFTGRMVPSARLGRKANMIKCWRLRESFSKGGLRC